MKRAANQMEMTGSPCHLALVDRDVHDAVAYEAFLYLTRADLLPKKIISSIIGTIELLFDFYVIKDAIHHGWAYSKCYGQLCPPDSFICRGWGATFPLLYDGNQYMRVPEHVYQTEPRRTGTRSPMLFHC